jgi:hypothetical protein
MRHAGFAFVCSVAFAALGLRAGAQGPWIAGGGSFDPFLMALKPEVKVGALPAWMDAPAEVKPELSLVEVPFPPDWRGGAVDMFAVTVVFNDKGDGGPALEWRAENGKASTVSYGLGEVGQGVGLNSRTVLLPQVLTRAGGTLVVSYYGNFDSLLSLAVRPAREDLLAVLGARRSPSLVDGGLQVYEDREVNGARQVRMTGDTQNGAIVEAELAAEVEEIEAPIEFVAPVEGEVEGGFVHLEALGLDPEARLELSVNGEPAAPLSFPAFELDDPSLVADWNGRLVLAGWRKGSVYVPARMLREGENSLVLSLKRSEGETGRQVFLRNTAIHLRFAQAPLDPAAWAGTAEDLAGQPVEKPSEPDFNWVEPALPVAEPQQGELPQVVTSPAR